MIYTGKLSKWWRTRSAKQAFARVAAERRKRIKLLKQRIKKYEPK